VGADPGAFAAVLHHALVVFLVFLFPLWDRRETRRLKTSTDPRVRVRSYQKTIGWQIVASVLLLATIPAGRLFAAPGSLASFGIDASPRFGLLLTVAMLAGAALPVVLTMRDPKARREQAARLETIAFFLPRTREERRWFAALSVTVGVCEEIIFRGFLILYLLAVAPWLGLAGAVVGAAAVFGIDHGYQGWTGVLATGFLAMVFTALFFLTGTLWVPIVVHALLDLRILLLVEPARESS
jgi:membrane protease YdiL (CAAX protease family)